MTLDEVIDKEIELSELLENESITTEEYQLKLEELSILKQEAQDSFDKEQEVDEQSFENIKEVNERKRKYSVLLDNAKANPLLDMATEVLPMMSYFTNQVEAYKYSSEGKDFMIHEMKKHIQEQGEFAGVLIRKVTPPMDGYPP